MDGVRIPSSEERLAFLQSRQAGIGGSDIAAIAGLDPFKTPMEVYLDKARPIDPENVDSEFSIHLTRGLVLEPWIAAMYADATGRTVRECDTSVHPDYEWARANMDYMIEVDSLDPGALEIKAPGRNNFDRIMQFGLSEGYICQLQWEMLCSGLNWGSFAIGSVEHQAGPVVHFDMEANRALQDELLELGRRFWTEHVAERVPPDPTSWEHEALQVPPHDGERHVVSDDQFIALTSNLMDAYELRNEAKDQYSRTSEALMEQMEERGITRAEVPGFGRINYDWRDGRTSFDRELLEAYQAIDPDKLLRLIRQADSLDMVERMVREGLCNLDLSVFTKQGDPYRVFRPYPAKERNDR